MNVCWLLRDFSYHCEDVRSDDGPIFFWSDAIFITQFAVMRGLTGTHLSRYSRTDCSGKIGQGRSEDASGHSPEEKSHTLYGIGDFITFYKHTHTHTHKDGHSAVPCSGSSIPRCVLISFSFIRPGFPSFLFNSICV